MTFDPTKLPPAPFAVSPLVHDSWGWIRDAEGAPAGRTDCSWLCGDLDEFRKAHEYGSPEYKRGPESVANLAEFYAMARNAYHYQRAFNISAVSMRRMNTFYWSVRLLGGYDMPLKFIVTQQHRGEFLCPIEAVCVAGKWLEENPTESA